MPNFAGTWKMKSSENFDELLKVLGVNAMLRKVAVAAASKPHVEIRQDGDQFYIKTSTTVRTTEINFKVGESFQEETVDGRKCRSLPTWENENKIHCKQTLLEGEGPKTYWTRELVGDELILTFGADDVKIFFVPKIDTADIAQGGPGSSSIQERITVTLTYRVFPRKEEIVLMQAKHHLIPLRSGFWVPSADSPTKGTSPLAPASAKLAAQLSPQGSFAEDTRLLAMNDSSASQWLQTKSRGEEGKGPLVHASDKN
ncbi:hypothetical protein JRQ81_006863 [Phrynocephalus forsythii]|uniref:Cytosolic fatty-acid binding proteins domain-containing protein n=1 Tax=Phrynocephalus forsythii TaxID=171643 RepID=A0A9Q0XFR0_9SAUR|nr:hypothetical protein JRQ81_006863 [Phrynocephalus forsythii]